MHLDPFHLDMHQRAFSVNKHQPSLRNPQSTYLSGGTLSGMRGIRNHPNQRLASEIDGNFWKLLDATMETEEVQREPPSFQEYKRQIMDLCNESVEKANREHAKQVKALLLLHENEVQRVNTEEDDNLRRALLASNEKYEARRQELVAKYEEQKKLLNLQSRQAWISVQQKHLNKDKRKALPPKAH